MTPRPPTIDLVASISRRLQAAARLLALAVAATAALGAAAQDKPPAAAASTSPAAGADGIGSKFTPSGWDLTLSPYTYHFHPSDEHEYVYAIGVIKRLEGNWIVGGSYFSNSFGQPSGYIYIGQRYENLPGFEKWYLQWNAGILYGYVEPYEDKVPFNYNGFSPGFVPSIGYKFTDRIYGELDLLGTSGLMFTLVFPIPKGGF
ncbi:MAG: hypothetical protein KA151_01470 [Piscinibacter sp.]|nr:hypothetical protein [Piscinibacter sp.]